MTQFMTGIEPVQFKFIFMDLKSAWACVLHHLVLSVINDRNNFNVKMLRHIFLWFISIKRNSTLENMKL